MKRAPNAKLFMILTIATTVFGGAGVGYLVSNRGAAQKEFSTIRKQIRDEKKVQAELKEQQNKLQESSEKLAHLEAGVPDSAYIPTLLTELEMIGRSHGLEVTGVKPKEQKDSTPAQDSNSTDKDKKKVAKKSYNELLIEVKGNGVYKSIEGFVNALQQFPKIVGVISVDLTPRVKFGERNEADDGNKHLDVTINLRAYAFPSPSDTASRDEAGNHEQTQG